MTPAEGWNWTYNGERLAISLKTEDGRKQTFCTHFRMRDLLNPPLSGEPFCLADARLLTVFRESFSELGLDDKGCLDLGINAVACERFVRPSIPVSRYFRLFEGAKLFESGSIVTVYTVNGRAGDCIVLETLDADDLVRLMLVNPVLILSEGKSVTLGRMIRVNPAAVCPFRAFSAKKSDEPKYA